MNNTAANTDQKPPTHYVGIGASAGGLEAIDAFFTHMPSHSGLAFIVIQRLSPDYKSLMVELLSKKTEMRVHRAEDGMAVEANQVYLIPPQKKPDHISWQTVVEGSGNHPVHQPAHRYISAVTGRRSGRAGGCHHFVRNRKRWRPGGSRHQGVWGHGHGAGSGERQI